jgi:hypothetical protein
MFPSGAPRVLSVAQPAIRKSSPTYRAYVRDVGNGYVSCETTLDDGLELSSR